MVNAGTAELTVLLNLQQIQQDAEEARKQIENRLKDIPWPPSGQSGGGGRSPSPRSRPGSGGGNSQATDATRQIDDLNAAVQRAQAVVADPAARKELEQQAQLFQENLRYKRQLAAIDDAGFSAEDASNARQLATELNKLNVQQIEQEFRQLDATATAGLQKIAVAAGAVSAAIAAIFANGTREFVEFDRSIRQAGVVSGASAEELEALRDEVEALGIATSKTPQELGQVSVAFSRAGFDAEQTAEALEGVTRASEATGESLGTTGDIIAKAIRAFGLATDQSGEVADSLVATANNTNTSVNGLGESLAYVSAQAKGSNQTLDDTLVLLGLLGDAGIQGSAAGTGLAQAYDRLKIASAGVETEFTGLVRGSANATAAFEAINAEVRNADGTMKSVLDVLPVIQQNLSNLSQQDQDILMKALFGVQGGRAFQTLLNASPDRIASVTTAVENSQGVALQSGEAMLQGLGGALDLFDGSMSSVNARFGEFASVGIEPAVRGATALLNGFLQLNPIIQNTLIATTGLAGVLAAATAAIAAYNLANGKRIAQETVAAALLIKQQAAIAGSIVALKAKTAAQLALAAATGRATAAQAMQIRGLVAGAAKAGLLAAAIASVAIAFDTYRQATSAVPETEAALERSRNATAEYEKALIALAESSEEAIEATTDAIENQEQAIRDSLTGLEQFIDKAREFVGLRTTFDQRRDEGSLQFGEIAEGADRVIADYRELVEATGGLAAASDEQTEILKANIAEQIAALEAIDPAVRANSASLQINLNVLRQAEEQLNATAAATDNLSDATQGNTQSTEEFITALEQQQSERLAALDRAAAEEQASILESGRSRQEIEAELARAEQTALEQRIEINRQALSELTQLRNNAANVDELRELNNQIVALDSQVANDRISLARSLAAERQRIEEEATEAALAAVEQAADEANRAIERSQQERITAIRQDQLARVEAAGDDVEAIAAIEQDAAARIEAIARDTANAQIAESERQLSEIRELRAQGLISSEEASSREAELQSQIGDATQERLEAEIQARQEAAEQALQITLDLIERELDAFEAQQQERIRILGRQSAELSNQNDLLSSQQNLQQALFDLDNQSLQAEIDRAEAGGRTADAARLRLELGQQEQSQLEASQAIARRALEIEQRQNRLTLQREETEARIAEARARSAVQAAIENGESEERIALLREELAAAEDLSAVVRQQQATQEQTDDIDRAAQVANQIRDRRSLLMDEANELRDMGREGGLSRGARQRLRDIDRELEVPARSPEAFASSLPGDFVRNLSQLSNLAQPMISPAQLQPVLPAPATIPGIEMDLLREVQQINSKIDGLDRQMNNVFNIQGESPRRTAEQVAVELERQKLRQRGG